MTGELRGETFAGKRDKIVLATKVGCKFNAEGTLAMIDGKPVVSGNLAHIHAAVEGSLRRLNTDYIDLVSLYCIDPIVPVEDTIGM
ncbi:aldo/keto reductase [Paraburkholderia sp. RL17-337-BIB-A]|uniref:aldo/keto reductase n=1 Tax=Paraburkholderia sp. RL17-337-BIB-A TaxID=3031636 RepID=UPI0038BD8825